MENNSFARKRRRGRPAGSKNKSREVVANSSENVEGDGTGTGMGIQMKLLEVAAGCDIIAAVYEFVNHYKVGGVSVTSTHGIVCNLTVYQPNRPPQSSPFYTYSSFYELLSLKGNFYGSSSSIRPPPPFSTPHIVSFLSCEGDFYAGVIQGKLTAATNVFLGVSVISGTDSIKLPLPPPPPPPRALPDPQPFFDLNEGMSPATAAVPEFFSGAGRSMISYGVPTPSPLSSWNPISSFFK